MQGLLWTRTKRHIYVGLLRRLRQPIPNNPECITQTRYRPTAINYRKQWDTIRPNRPIRDHTACQIELTEFSINPIISNNMFVI